MESERKLWVFVIETWSERGFRNLLRSIRQEDAILLVFKDVPESIFNRWIDQLYEKPK